MSAVGFFIFGLFITAIVSTACALIDWGVVAERREREDLGETRISPSSN
ncbi:MAG: hypothetical protein WEB05_02395 [Solirubrobacterales bacterium]